MLIYRFYVNLWILYTLRVPTKTLWLSTGWGLRNPSRVVEPWGGVLSRDPTPWGPMPQPRQKLRWWEVARRPPHLVPWSSRGVSAYKRGYAGGRRAPAGRWLCRLASRGQSPDRRSRSWAGNRRFSTAQRLGSRRDPSASLVM